MFLVTSNEKKLAEFRRFGLDIDIRKGIDLPEVSSDSITVVTYKALAAGKDMVVEDTILTVGGEEVVDIRWKINELPDDARAEWIVSLGWNDGDTIRVYRGIVRGSIKVPDTIDSDAFGFDQYFTPDDIQMTLHDLEKRGTKDAFSARKLAVNALLNNDPVVSRKICDIPQWTGNFQH